MRGRTSKTEPASWFSINHTMKVITVPHRGTGIKKAGLTLSVTPVFCPFTHREGLGSRSALAGHSLKSCLALGSLEMFD